MSNTATFYFRNERKSIFYAINTDTGFFMHVLIMKQETIIQFNSGKNASELKLSSCLESEHLMSCTELEFSQAIGKADQVLHETPFL